MPQHDATLVYNVVQLARDGMRRRAIARALRISRNTVRKILQVHGVVREQPHSALTVSKKITRASKLDPFRQRIDVMLAQYPDITSQRVFEKLRDEEGYSGGDTIVKDLVRRIRKKPPNKPSLETPPREPGDMAECDWSPYAVTFTHAPPMTLQVLGYTLRYSTRKFYSFHEGNGLHPLMDGHVHAFARFGGAARRCKYDNQKPVVLRWEGNQPIYNLRFIDFAAYYEFIAVACHRQSPNEKPRVERSFYELTLSFFRGRSFRDLADLNGQLVHWMNTIADPRPIKRMRRRTRMELFAEETPLLRPLPRHPFDTARVLYKLCDIEGFIAWEGNWYSLPYEHVTDILPVRITERELFVYDASLACIARHELKPRGAQLRSILPGHRPTHAERGPGLDQLRLVFDGLGEPAAAFLKALEQKEPRSAGYHARQVLSMREGYDTASLLAALAHALAYGALRHDDVERILIARAPRRRLDDYVCRASRANEALERGGCELNDLSAYDALPCRGAKNQDGEATCQSDATEQQQIQAEQQLRAEQPEIPSSENASPATSNASD
jgi:transposase